MWGLLDVVLRGKNENLPPPFRHRTFPSRHGASSRGTQPFSGFLCKENQDGPQKETYVAMVLNYDRPGVDVCGGKNLN
jgi:hypothetical protein